MDWCCCCRKKAKSKSDDDTDVSEPLLKAAAGDDDSSSLDPAELQRDKSIGELVDVSERSLSNITGGIPELAHNPEIVPKNAVGNMLDMPDEEEPLDGAGIIPQLKDPKVTKKVSFEDSIPEKEDMRKGEYYI